MRSYEILFSKMGKKKKKMQDKTYNRMLEQQKRHTADRQKILNERKKTERDRINTGKRGTRQSEKKIERKTKQIR